MNLNDGQHLLPADFYRNAAAASPIRDTVVKGKGAWFLLLLLLPFLSNTLAQVARDNLGYLALQSVVSTQSEVLNPTSFHWLTRSGTWPPIDACFGRWVLLAKSKRYAEAHELYRSKQCEFLSNERRHMLAKWTLRTAGSLVDQQKFSQADALYDVALMLNAFTGDLLAAKGALYSAWQRPHDAIAAFETAEEHEPSRKAVLRYSIGMQYYKIGRMDLAEIALGQAVWFEQISPAMSSYQLPSAYYTLGAIDLQQGHLQTADTCFHKAQTLDSDNANGIGFAARVGRGDVALRLGNPGMALSLYEEAAQIAFRPVHVSRAHVAMSQAFEEQRMWDSALEEARLAVLLDPSNKWAYATLARILLRFGRCGEAEHTFRVFIDLDPEDNYAQPELSAFVGNCVARIGSEPN